ncbi:hypothetical protein GQ53DRAFT_744565 [Thozetella sp. PMI_491]|nr:hypothetical protein GQ53DRAFT_744565 [Thozetella sp. PMI_491]
MSRAPKSCPKAPRASTRSLRFSTLATLISAHPVTVRKALWLVLIRLIRLHRLRRCCLELIPTQTPYTGDTSLGTNGLLARVIRRQSALLAR